MTTCSSSDFTTEGSWPKPVNGAPGPFGVDDEKELWTIGWPYYSAQEHKQLLEQLLSRLKAKERYGDDYQRVIGWLMQNSPQPPEIDPDNFDITKWNGSIVVPDPNDPTWGWKLGRFMPAGLLKCEYEELEKQYEKERRGMFPWDKYTKEGSLFKVRVSRMPIAMVHACIDFIRETCPLAKDLADMMRAVAPLFKSPRFKPLTTAERMEMAAYGKAKTEERIAQLQAQHHSPADAAHGSELSDAHSKYSSDDSDYRIDQDTWRSLLRNLLGVTNKRNLPPSGAGPSGKKKRADE